MGSNGLSQRPKRPLLHLPTIETLFTPGNMYIVHAKEGGYLSDKVILNASENVLLRSIGAIKASVNKNGIKFCISNFRIYIESECLF